MNKILNEIISFFRLKGRPNLTAGILCVVAGMIFWFFNALNKNYSTNINYPVRFLYDTDAYQPVEELPDEVLLNMSGVGWNLLRKTFKVSVEPLQIRLEFPDQTAKIPGSSLPSVITDQISDLTLNYVLTDTLFLQVNRKISKDFTLYVNPDSIAFDENYLLQGDILLSESTVELTGPSSLLDALGDTITLEILDTEIDEDFSDEVTIELDREELIQRDPPSVTVSFAVELKVNERVQVPVTMVNFPEDMTLADTLIMANITYREGDPVSGTEIEVTADYLDASDSTLIPKISSYPQRLISITLDSANLKIIPYGPPN